MMLLQGGAKRRRQASRTAYVPEDEDDEFGSQMTDARNPRRTVASVEGSSDADYLLGDEEEDDFADVGSSVAADGMKPRQTGATLTLCVNEVLLHYASAI